MYVCKACGRVSEEMLEECPDGVILNIDDRDVRLPCSTWPYTREMAKVALQKKESTDCVFAGTILVGDKTIEVTSILPAGIAEDLVTIGQELRLVRIKQVQELEEKLARARAEEALREEEQRKLSENGMWTGGVLGAIGAGPNANMDHFDHSAFCNAFENQRRLLQQEGASAVQIRAQQERSRQQAYEWGREFARRQAERRAAENKPEVTVQEEEETAKEEADKQKGFFKRMLEKGWF